MLISPRFLHTNLVTANWQRLAAFYEDVFGCTRVLPERDLAGEAVQRGSGVPGARVRGVHLRLPGLGSDGPTLEIFEYHEVIDTPRPAANRIGFGHIAFAVGDVTAAREQVLAAGGAALGTVEEMVVPGVGRVTWTYVRDPDGNIIELQRREAS